MSKKETNIEAIDRLKREINNGDKQMAIILKCLLGCVVGMIICLLIQVYFAIVGAI